MLSPWLWPGLCGLLVLAILLVFGQTLRHPFVNYDDDFYIFQNPDLARGLSLAGINWAFTNVHFYFYHPLTWISLLADFQLYGLAPWGYHLTSILLHTAATLVLFWAFWRMTGDVWPSALVAALFAIHPLHVESVAWAAERKGTLSGLLFMLALAAYVPYARRPESWARYLTVVAIFALGLLSKPMVVTLPCVLLLLDYWPLGRMRLARNGCSSFGTSLAAECEVRNESPFPPLPLWRLVAEKIPFFLLAAAFSVVARMAEGDAVMTLDVVPMSERIANALVSYVTYLGQFFCPIGLTCYYPHPEDSLPHWAVVGSALLLLGITAAALAGWRRFPYLLVGWLWFVGTLVPMSGLIQVGGFGMADRYTYLTQIGLYVAVAWGVARLAAVWPSGRWLLSVTTTVALLGLMACAWQQTSYWRGDEALWHHTVANTTRNYFAHNILGGTLGGRGQFDAAIAQYHKALEVKPDYPQVRCNLAMTLLQSGRPEDAIVEFRKVLALTPNDAAVRGTLGLALQQVGRLDEAAAECQRALSINPSSSALHNNLGDVLNRQGKTAEAVAQFRQAIAVEPGNAQAHNNLAAALQRQGNASEAIVHLRESVRLQPDNIAYLNQLAWLLATAPEPSLRNDAEAVALAQRAVLLNGGREPRLLDTLAAAFAESRQFTNAIETAQRALALASANGNTALADTLRARIKLYQAGSPYRDSSGDRHP
jgi:protein O-mannosyl-transferase